jgi:hypothetical protein
VRGAKLDNACGQAPRVEGRAASSRPEIITGTPLKSPEKLRGLLDVLAQHQLLAGPDRNPL